MKPGYETVRFHRRKKNHGQIEKVLNICGNSLRPHLRRLGEYLRTTAERYDTIPPALLQMAVILFSAYETPRFHTLVS